jgi:hypothetical protein
LQKFNDLESINTLDGIDFFYDPTFLTQTECSSFLCHDSPYTGLELNNPPTASNNYTFSTGDFDPPDPPGPTFFNYDDVMESLSVAHAKLNHLPDRMGGAMGNFPEDIEVEHSVCSTLSELLF